MSITLLEDSQTLEEVVVIGYGTAKKKDLTGAVAQIKTDKLEKQSPGTVQDILRNGMPGLNVGVSTDAKGGGSLQVRGQRSLKANNEPLLVLDGMIFYGELSEINPLDIEQIDMLKDAASAAVYGAKSANGVILITTKKGKTAKPVIRFDASIGTATIGPAQREIYDAEGFLKYREDLFSSRNNFVNPDRFAKPTPENLSKYGLTLEQWLAYTPAMTGDPEDIWLRRLNVYDLERENYFNGKTYDWWDASFQAGLRQDYNFSISGVSDRFNYYWSLGYMNNEGMIVGDKYYTFRSNLKLDAKATDWLNIGLNLNYQDKTENGMAVNALSQITGNSPYALPVDDEGNLIYKPAGSFESGSTNSAFDNQYKTKENGWSTFNTTLYAKVKLPFNITYSLNFAPRHQWHHYRYHESSQNPYWGDNGRVDRQAVEYFDWQVDNVLNWNQTFADKHQFAVTLMQGAEEHRKWQENITARNFTPTDALGFHYIDIADMLQSSFSSEDTHSTGDALMARLFYSFDNRYMLTASVRRDGYSAFGMKQPRATFPSIALAWNFVHEKFFNWESMSTGKLRLSWGKNGNRDIGIYQALSHLTTGSGKYPYVKPDGSVGETSQLYADRMANYGLKWESTASWNVGFDLGFLNNRINATIDAYHMPTTDLLMDQSLPQVLGYNNVITNLGEVLNRGLELSVNSVNIQKNNFTWSSDFGFSLNRNKIVHLYYEYEDILDANGNVIGQKERDDISNNWFVGHDINSIWTYNNLGVWQLGEEEAAAKYGQLPGDQKVKDVIKPGDTEPDYKYTNEDKEFLGYTTPRFRFSLRNDFTVFKNWDVSLTMYSHLGQKSTTRFPANHEIDFPERSSSYVRKYWTPDNPTNQYARLQSVNPQNVSPPFIRNRSFLRLDNFAVAYNLPKQMAQKFQMQNIRIYGNIRNIMVITPEWGYWDPETDNATPRYYTIGVNITL